MNALYFWQNEKKTIRGPTSVATRAVLRVEHPRNLGGRVAPQRLHAARRDAHREDPRRDVRQVQVVPVLSEAPPVAGDEVSQHFAIQFTENKLLYRRRVQSKKEQFHSTIWNYGFSLEGSGNKNTENGSFLKTKNTLFFNKIYRLFVSFLIG